MEVRIKYEVRGYEGAICSEQNKEAKEAENAVND